MSFSPKLKRESLMRGEFAVSHTITSAPSYVLSLMSSNVPIKSNDGSLSPTA